MSAKKTALYEIHKKLNARIVEFAGYLMPIQYKGIMDEHRRVRQTVGIFDVSHMGEFIISGEKSLDFLQLVTINDVARLDVFQVQYSAMCYENGGIVDDLLVYRFPDHYMTVVNASNLEKDFRWMQSHLIPGVELKNASDDFTLLAVQGPDSVATLQKLTPVDLSAIEYYWMKQEKLADVEAIISRTGYTGEPGFEIGFAPEYSEKVWNAIMDAGQEFQIEPVGLGARDTLRLEMKYCLYGNDIDQTTHPLEAGLGWITRLKKGQFIGRDAILNAKEKGLTRKLVGIELEGKAIPRHGYEIYKDEQQVGVITSGTFSPMLEKGIAIGYLAVEYTEPGTDIDIMIRNRKVPATVVKTPFYKHQ
ncbi:glycine cleavage system aminomethyltransferase GcvT [candidate division KSB1 bacterium]|nr:glycine cleavage system aminomethyltransferase GcvT [candidate division KSB1 bacterium]